MDFYRSFHWFYGAYMGKYQFSSAFYIQTALNKGICI